MKFDARAAPFQKRERRPRRRAGRYLGFNLLVSDGAEVWSLSNMEGDLARLGPGVWGLSNHLLETPLPKVTTARSRLQAALGEADGAVRFTERSFGPGGVPLGEVRETFEVRCDPPP